MAKKNKNKKGSVLIFTFFIMFLILLTGISLVSVSLSGRRSTLASGKSVNAFQIADSGLEAVLEQIKIGTASDVDGLATTFCDDSDSSDNFILNDSISGGKYEVRFYDDGGTPDDTTDDNQLECIDNLNLIYRIKSTGFFRGTARSVETTLVTNP
ncbi:MAG: pilus assembly PilX N-terminal domain-containing protein [Candidatus Moranbacteria bacterium]|jgi:hypothetical protein|nr:pilus assembly PilX N-terminal domain-containing protein [Candidatus Moranbacteria bacterium]MDX9855380.1 pilus assembly PilX N-terminal domain-containing protein [Candidatus Moranbacteria bacterium]